MDIPGSPDTASPGTASPDTASLGRGRKALRALATGLLVFTLGAGAVACGDDPGEDVIGDGEINDSGD